MKFKSIVVLDQQETVAVEGEWDVRDLIRIGTGYVLLLETDDGLAP